VDILPNQLTATAAGTGTSQLFVRDLGGKIRTINISLLAGLKDLCSQVHIATGIPICLQRLSCGLSFINDSEPLYRQGIRHQDTIIIKLRLLGGMDTEATSSRSNLTLGSPGLVLPTIPQQENTAERESSSSNEIDRRNCNHQANIQCINNLKRFFNEWTPEGASVSQSLEHYKSSSSTSVPETTSLSSQIPVDHHSDSGRSIRRCLLKANRNARLLLDDIRESRQAAKFFHPAGAWDVPQQKSLDSLHLRQQDQIQAARKQKLEKKKLGADLKTDVAQHSTRALKLNTDVVNTKSETVMSPQRGRNKIGGNSKSRHALALAHKSRMRDQLAKSRIDSYVTSSSEQSQSPISPGGKEQQQRDASQANMSGKFNVAVLNMGGIGFNDAACECLPELFDTEDLDVLVLIDTGLVGNKSQWHHVKFKDLLPGVGITDWSTTASGCSKQIGGLSIVTSPRLNTARQIVHKDPTGLGVAASVDFLTASFKLTIVLTYWK